MIVITSTLLGVGLNNSDNGISLAVLTSTTRAKRIDGTVLLAGVDSTNTVKLLRLQAGGGLV